LGVASRLSGPSHDFRLGRIFEAAAEEVNSKVLTSSDKAKRWFQAKAEFRRRNCRLLTSHPLGAEPEKAFLDRNRGASPLAPGSPSLIPDLIPTGDLVSFCGWETIWGEGYCTGYLDRMMESYECYELHRFGPHAPALGYIEQPSPTRWSKRPNSTASIRKPGSPTRWPASPITRSTNWTSSCLGVTLRTERNWL